MDTTRRQFVGLLGATALASGTSLSASGALAATSSARNEFAFSDDRIPLNAANLCPSPRRVAQAVTEYTRVIDADPSFQNRAQFSEFHEDSRGAVARQLGVSADEIALVRNTSEANNIINAGFPLERGDEVVVWEQNHPTNLVAWKVRAKRYGLRVVEVSVPADPTSIDELLEPLRRAITPRTRLLTVTHVSNVSGLKMPARELAELCHARNIHFHLDGAQTWGALDVNLAELGCDSFSGSAHKWFMGPKEVGVLYVKTDAIDKIWPAVVAPGWGSDADTDLVGARKFENLGQRDDAAVAAIGVAAAMHSETGPANVEAHMMRLSRRLKEGLVEAGAKLVTPMSADFSGGVCISRVERANRREIYDRLYREHGIICAPTGGLRICPHLYNTEEHIDRAVAGVRAMRHLLA